MIKFYPEYLALVRDVIKDAIDDYVNYKKAQITLWKYDKKDNFCTACGVLNRRELEAMVVVSEYEKIQKNKRDMMTRLRNSKKTA